MKISKAPLRAVSVPTRVGCWWFVVDPLDDFETILGSDNGDAGNTGDEVLQGNTTLHCLIPQAERTELCCIAVWKTERKLLH